LPLRNGGGPTNQNQQQQKTQARTAGVMDVLASLEHRIEDLEAQVPDHRGRSTYY
jgi:hypothetical protein